MAENKPIAWYTKNGKHIPIFDVKVPSYNEYQKNRQINQSKEQADRLNGKSNGLSEDFVITKFVSSANESESKKLEERRIEYANKLKQAGFFGTEEELDTALKSTGDWNKMMWAKRMVEDGDNYYHKATPEELMKGAKIIGDNVYMDFDDFKNLYMSSGENMLNLKGAPNTLAEGFDIFFSGSNKSGYGQYVTGGKHGARIIWDEKYGVSKFIDSHKDLQLNTNNPTYRGLRLTNKGMADLQKALESGKSIDMRGPSSWTLSKSTAKTFVDYSLKGQRNNNLVIFADITKGIRKAIPFTRGLDSEILYSGTNKFNVLSIDKDSDYKGVYYVTVANTER